MGERLLQVHGAEFIKEGVQYDYRYKKHDTKRKGDITELKVLTRLMECGYNVLVPWGDNTRYDLIFEDKEGEFKRVQCKTGRISTNRSIEFSVCSSSYHRTGMKYTYHGQIDYFAVYCSEGEQVYLVLFKDVSKCKKRLL